MSEKVTIIGGEPTVAVLADMTLDYEGVGQMVEWVRTHRPDCIAPDYKDATDLFPHKAESEGGRELSGNELLVELSGRKCYDSFGKKAGRKSNKEYIENTQSGNVKHASIMYHAKMTFFLAGISRRVSHELIRNYVGADRDEEGSPSQESTRFTHHYGWFIAPPRIIKDPSKMKKFEISMQWAYDDYQRFIAEEMQEYELQKGETPKGMDRKRIYEAASHLLHHSAETSFIWTTNPVALAKLFRERGDEAADLEFQRLVKVWKPLALSRWPNLFPGVT